MAALAGKVARTTTYRVEQLVLRPITMSDVRLVAGEGRLTAHETLAGVNGVLRIRAAQQFDRETAALMARIILDEIGGEVCTPEWAQAAADRIVCALSNP